MLRRNFLRLSAGLTAAALAPYLSCNRTSGGRGAQPNILIIYTDDQGFHDVSSYGSEIPTPNIDRIGKAGIRFTDFHVAAPVCTPSRYSLLTGAYPHRSKENLVAPLMPGEHAALDASETTLATWLKSVGYTTALIGKWHLGKGAEADYPMNHGFDYFTGFVGGCIDYWDHGYAEEPDWWVDGKARKEAGYSTDLISDHAINYLERQKDGQKPFFLYLSYNAPHYGKTADQAEPQGTLRAGEFNFNGIHAWNTLQAPPAYIEKFSHIQDEKRRYYAAMVSCLDDNIGRVLDKLEATGQVENTMLWFISDNGGSIPYGGQNLPLNGEKRLVLEGGIRVPAMLMWKNRIKPGQLNSQVICNTDIVPTLAALTGFKTGQRPIDGLDISGVILNGGRVDRDLFFNAFGFGAYRRGRWKYYVQHKAADNSGPGFEVKAKKEWRLLNQVETEWLFDLENDLGEQNNLAGANPEKLNEMRLAYNAKFRELAGR